MKIRPTREYEVTRLILRLAVCCVLLSMVSISFHVSAGEVNLTWDPSQNASGYRAYRGTASGDYSSSSDEGNSTTANMLGLDDCVTWYFAVTAYNAAGVSGFSAEVASFPRAQLIAAVPSTVEQGTQTSISISGLNFQAGDVVTVSNSGVQVDAVTVNACNEMVLSLTVAPDASPGAADITIIHSSGVAGTGAGLLTVTAPDPLAIENVAVTTVTGTSAVVSWSTNEPADSRVLFRKQDNELYQTAGEDELVSEHTVLLTGLAPETAYDFHVAGTNAAGQSTNSSPDETFTTTSSPYEYVRFEAEAGVFTDPVEPASGPEAFAGAWIETPAGSPPGTPNSPLGDATHGLYIPSAGTWQLWLRVYGADSASDSWFVSVDGAAFEPVSAQIHGAWTWVAAGAYSLTTGQHVVQLGGFDPGARADRLLLTDDPDFLPTEEPDIDVTPPGPVTGLIAEGGAGEIQLSWSHPVDADLDTVVVRVRSDGVFPTSPADGTPLAEEPATPGGTGGFVHTGVPSGVTYHYGVFAIDGSGNASPAGQVVGTTMAVPAAPTSVAVN